MTEKTVISFLSFLPAPVPPAVILQAQDPPAVIIQAQVPPAVIIQAQVPPDVIIQVEVEVETREEDAELNFIWKKEKNLTVLKHCILFFI